MIEVNTWDQNRSDLAAMIATTALPLEVARSVAEAIEPWSNLLDFVLALESRVGNLTHHEFRNAVLQFDLWNRTLV